MQLLPHPPCRRCFDFTAYLNGDVRGYHKTALEQHLSVCDACFEALIEVLNRHLNQTASWPFIAAAPQSEEAMFV